MDKGNLAGNAGLSSSAVKIGILGGIGPEATGEFYNKLVKRLQERRLIKRNSDYPQIIINSINAPELVFDKISNADLKPYVDGLKLLDRNGVDFIVVVCNTIHLYYEILQKKIKTPILDLRKAVKKNLTGKKGKVLVLGTPATIKRGLYEFRGVEYFRLTKKETGQISDSILRFNRGGNSKKPVTIAKKYKRKGARIILACTELALMLENENIPNINTVDVLVDATVDKFLSLKYQGDGIINKRVDWDHK